MIVFQNGIYNAEKDALINSTSKYPVLFEINAEYLGNEEVQTPYMDKIIMQATGGDVDTLERFYQCLGYIYSQGTEAKNSLYLEQLPIVEKHYWRIYSKDNRRGQYFNYFA